MVELAENFAASAPRVVPRRVYFEQFRRGGYEGAAMKLSRRYHHRPRQIRRLQVEHFMAVPLGSLSLTGRKVVQRKGFGPSGAGVFHPISSPYRLPKAGKRLRQHRHQCVRAI